MEVCKLHPQLMWDYLDFLFFLVSVFMSLVFLGIFFIVTFQM